MMQAAKKQYTVEEYLALEARSDERHEYFQGHMYQMAGGTSTHYRIATNIGGLLFVALRGTTCEVFKGETRVLVRANGLYTHPDASVACNADFLPQDGQDSLTNPIVIIEILSDSTEKYNRTKKFDLYKGLESLQNYILIDQHQPYIQYYERAEGRFWKGLSYEGVGENLFIAALNITLPLADIYDRVEWPASPPE